MSGIDERVRMLKIIPVVWVDGDTEIIEIRLAANERIARRIVRDMMNESAEDRQDWERYEDRWNNGESWIEIFDPREVEEE